MKYTLCEVVALAETEWHELYDHRTRTQEERVCQTSTMYTNQHGRAPHG